MKTQMGRFTKDSAITLAARILQLILGIGTAILIARSLGPQGNGIYSLAILFPSLLMNFGSLGIGPASVYFIGKGKYSSQEVLGNNILLSFLLGFLGIMVGLVVLFLNIESLFRGVEKIYLLLGLILVPIQFFISFINFILLGIRKIREFNFIDILKVLLFSIFLSILLLGFRCGIVGAIAATILSQFITAIILFYVIKKIVGSFQITFNKLYFRTVFNYGFKVFLGNLIGFLHYRVDIFLINIILNPFAVGLYAVAVGLGEKIGLLSQSAGIVLFPKVSSETDKNRLNEFTPLVTRNILFITAVGAALLFLIGRLLILLFYSDKFTDSVLPFRIILIGIVTMSGWRILANDIYGRGKPELNIYISMVSLLLNIVLNIIFIPKLGIIGTAWATSISYTVAFILIIIVYCRLSGNTIYKVIFVQKSDYVLYKGFIVSMIQRMMPSQ